MAALRHGIRTVILPEDNRKDLEEIDQTVRRALNFLPVRHVDQVLEAALDLPPVDAETPKPASKEEPPIAIPAARQEQKPSIRQ